MEISKTEEMNIMRKTFLLQIRDAIPWIEGRELVIWGTRDQAAIAREVLESFRLQCRFFVSSRPRTDTFCGKPLCTPDALDVKKHYVIVTTMAEEVRLLLKNSGFEANRDYMRLLDHSIWHEDMEYNGCWVGRGTYGYDTLRDDDLLGQCVSRIGRYCSINGTARIQQNHKMDFVTTYPIAYLAPIIANEEIFSMESKVKLKGERSEIGNDVWIGANVTLIEGKNIGDGAIIGAGAVVTHDVEPYAVAGGVPARVIRYRYPKEMIDAFLRIKWWDWPVEKINANFEFFYDPKRFCEMFDR